MGPRIFPTVMLVVWSILLTIDAIRIAAGHADWLTGAFAALAVVFIVINGKRILAPKEES